MGGICFEFLRLVVRVRSPNTVKIENFKNFQFQNDIIQLNIRDPICSSHRGSTVGNNNVKQRFSTVRAQ